MTFDEVLAKRNQVRETRNTSKKELEKLADYKLVERMTNAEYSWGYWDGVMTVMQKLKLKEVTA